MNLSRKIIFTAALAALPLAAIAQGNFNDRDVEQQRRIEQGLRSGELTVQEASRLERETSRVNQLESRALRDGTVSDAERAQINRAQDRISQDIARERSDGERGNPNSPSSRRMQTDVQRNVNQEERISQGMRSGQLTNREAGRLENDQARSNRMQARAGADGHISGNEQRRIQGAENRDNRRIYNERHDYQSHHDGGYRQSSADRHNGGFRGNSQPRFQQQRYYAQVGRRHSR